MKKRFLLLATVLISFVSVLLLTGCNIKLPSPDKLTISVSTTESTNENVEVTIKSTASSDFSVQYKINNNEWNNYSDSFVVNENCTVYARFAKKGKYSNTISKVISNIHKTSALLENFEVIETTTYSISVNANATTPLAYTVYHAIDNEEYVLSDSCMKTFMNLTQNTLHTLKIKVVDAAGNVSEQSINGKTQVIKLFNTNNVSSNPSEQTKNDVVLTANNSTVYTLLYSLNNETWIEYNETEKITIPNDITVYFRLKDNKEQLGEITEYEVNNIDKDAPLIENIEQLLITTNSVSVEITASDKTNLKYYFTLDNGHEILANSNVFCFANLTQSTEYSVKVRVVDIVGNETEELIKISTLCVPKFDVNNLIISEKNLTNQNIEITINETFPYNLEYSFNNNTWTLYNSAVPITITEKTKIYFRLVDSSEQVGLTSEFEITNIDKTAPVIENFLITDAKTVSIEVTITASDENTLTFYFAKGGDEYVKSESNVYTFTELSQSTLYTLWIKVVDAAGNITETYYYATTNMIPSFGSANITKSNNNLTNQNIILTAENSSAFNLEYSFDKLTWFDYSEINKIAVTENGNVYFRLKNVNNEYGPTTTYKISNIDKTPPIITLFEMVENNHTAIQVSVAATDENLLKYYFAINNGDYVKSITNAFTYENLEQNTTYTLKIKVVDAANNISEQTLEVTTSFVPVFDVETNLVVSSTELTNHDIILTARDLGEFVLEYSFDNINFNNYNNQIVISENKIIYFRLKDNFGHFGQTTEFNVSNIDKIAPQINSVVVGTTTSNSIKICVNASDINGLNYYFGLDDEAMKLSKSDIYTFANLTQNTRYLLKVEVSDNAGNKTSYSVENTTLLIPNFNEKDIIISDSIEHNALIELKSNNTDYQLEYSFNGIDYTDYTDTIITNYKETVSIHNELEENLIEKTNKRIYVRYKDASNQTSITLFEKEINFTLSYLTIGNSFSSDSMRMIPAIAKQLGYTNLELGYLYFAGRGINDHINSYNNNDYDYDFYNYNSATNSWVKNINYSLADAVKLLNWNIIILQQRSADSGIASTYSNLPDLVNIIDSIKTNKNSRYAFNMTWAYQETGVPGTYEQSQIKMYNAIVDSVKSSVVSLATIPTIIPAGTTIQNLRTSYIGDTICNSDMKHITLEAGKIANSAVFMKALSGINIDTLVYGSDFYGTPEKYFDIIIESVNNAMKNPFNVTPSIHTEEVVEDINEDGIDMGKFNKISLSYTSYAAWNSGSVLPNATLVENPESTTTVKFMASNSFSASKLPIGTRIILQGKITVRCEGWVDSTTKTPSANRPQNYSNYNNVRQLIIIDANFIVNFTIRAFNISSSENLTDALITELPTRIRIYVPK